MPVFVAALTVPGGRQSHSLAFTLTFLWTALLLNTRLHNRQVWQNCTDEPDAWLVWKNTDDRTRQQWSWKAVFFNYLYL